MRAIEVAVDVGARHDERAVDGGAHECAARDAVAVAQRLPARADLPTRKHTERICLEPPSTMCTAPEAPLPASDPVLQTGPQQTLASLATMRTCRAPWTASLSHKPPSGTCLARAVWLSPLFCSSAQA